MNAYSRSKKKTLDSIYWFPLHFFRALAASCVLYNRAGHSLSHIFKNDDRVVGLRVVKP